MMRQFTVRHIGLLTLALMLVAGSALAASAGHFERVAPDLQARLDASSGMIDVVAYLKPAPMVVKPKDMNLQLKARSKHSHAALLENLKANTNTEAFVRMLDRHAASGQVSNINSFWIADVVSFSVASDLLPEIAGHEDLYYLVEDVPLQLIDPVSLQESESGQVGSSGAVDLTGIRELWNRGYTGYGRLVCSFDTGVEGSHPALASRWLGVNGAAGEQSWFDPFFTSFPVDANGHGTHTMGIMVGRDGADTIGVAFNANWISAAVIDRGQSLSKTVSDIIAAFQWAADPDGNPNTVDDLPDVVCNSWGIPVGLFEPCDPTFWQAIDNLEALGVVAVFACGNEGPNPGSIRNPADRGSSPLNSFSVGAVDQSQVDLPVAEFSSRGPGSCSQNSIKPEIVAPGVAIRSSYKNGGYRVISGTSMAAPLVAGCVALMREYNPDASVTQIKEALLLAAEDLGEAGEDNDYGWGFINAARALDYLPQPEKPSLRVVGVDLTGATDGILAPGNTTGLELTVVDHFADVIGLWGRLRTESPYATALLDSAYFGDVAADGQVGNYDYPFLVKLGHDTPFGVSINYSIDFYSAVQGYINTAEFSLIAGQTTAAGQVSLRTDRIGFEVTNFGISRSLDELTSQSSPLSWLSLIIADQSGQVYDGLPGNLDFLASDSLTAESNAGTVSALSTYRTDDHELEIEQVSSVFNQIGDDSYVLINYRVTAPLGSNSELRLGLAVDVDLTTGEVLQADGDDIIFAATGSSEFVGVRLIAAGSVAAQAVPGGDIKSGSISDGDKYQLLLTTQSSLSLDTSDVALLASFSPGQLAAGTAVEFALILAVGNSFTETKLALERGQSRLDQATDVDEDNGPFIPTDFTLEQNYPNPFNGETLIGFSLPASGDYTFEIFNLLGQRVDHHEIVAAAAGRQVMTWDGTDTSGQPVASGVYFYRVTFSGNSVSRKMVLLK